METFHLKVIAYDKVFFDGQAQSLKVPTLDGAYQILANHEPYVIAVIEGEVIIKDENGKEIPAVCGRGFSEVNFTNGEVELLVDTMERPEEIDVRRAQEAKERAEERLRQHQSKMEYYRTTASLSRAMARLKEANKYRHS